MVMVVPTRINSSVLLVLILNIYFPFVCVKLNVAHSCFILSEKQFADWDLEIQFSFHIKHLQILREKVNAVRSSVLLRLWDGETMLLECCKNLVLALCIENVYHK